MKHCTHWLLFGFVILFSTALLSGCSHADKKQPVTAAEPVPQATATPASQDRPSGVDAELVTITATVKAIDKKKRVVTLKFSDGNEKKIKCGPEVRNFPQIRIGDEVKAQFLESVELVVSGPGAKPSTEREAEVARAPLGKKPGYAAIEAVEISATIQAIDYQTRDVTLLGPEGKTLKVKAGPEVKRFNEVKQGDTVLARLTKAVSITVSKPGKR